MADRISQDIIEEVRASTDIVSLISEYVPLRKRGQNYFGPCPFHSERTPSFSVNPQRQIYHCFGCGAGGNVFSFLMAHEKMSFPEAVRFLAQRANISIPEIESGKKDQLALLVKTNQFATSFFQDQLRSSRRAQSYLQSRGFGGEIIRAFGLGFAPPGWDNLIKAARAHSLSEDLLCRAGLAVRREDRGSSYDIFRDRLIFPIHNLSHQVIAFGGRALASDQQPKYLNSPETSLYQKGKMLYGLSITKGEIRRSDLAIIVEGYTDLLSLFQAGFTNVVASLGTSLTIDQAHLLSRYAAIAVVLYDADEAGTRASLRGIELLLAAGMEVRLVSLPPGSDPDGFVHSRGAEDMKRSLSTATDFVDFVAMRLRERYDLSTVSGKRAAIEEISTSLAKIKDDIRRSFYLRRVAELFSLREGLISQVVNRIRGKGTFKGGTYAVQLSMGPERVERELLGLFLRDPQLIERAAKFISPEDFSETPHRRLANILFGSIAQGGSPSPAQLMDLANEADLNQLISELSWEDNSLENEGKLLEDYVAKIKKAALCRERDALKAQMDRLKDESEIQRALRRFHQISAELRE